MPNWSLSASDKEKIIHAIQQAELETSGEIRVHIESDTQLEPLQRALQVFDHLQMGSTQLKNAVLIYIAYNSRKLAILGDSGIHDKVGSNFWEAEKQLMTDYFTKSQYADGIALAVSHVGEKLKAFFPWQSNDTNELSNDISFGGPGNEA